MRFGTFRPYYRPSPEFAVSIEPCRFRSLSEALEFIRDRYAAIAPERLWLETESGLAVPSKAPQYLFRGEGGTFPTTVAAIYRPKTYCLKDGTRLSSVDLDVLQRLVHHLTWRFMEQDYSLDADSAIGLLQHYGLPTWIVDLTAHLGYAFAFAAAGGDHQVGRVAVCPFRSLVRVGRVARLTDHPWADRPRRQGAFGVSMPREMTDLKSQSVMAQLGITWFEFPIVDSDREYLRERHRALVDIQDDPTAGFLRHHITEYVEAYGKFSPTLSSWLLERIPIAPRCYRVESVAAREVVVCHEAPNVLPVFDELAEAEYTRRYWSSVHAETSWERMKNWRWPPVGSIAADPRTYHGNP